MACISHELLKAVVVSLLFVSRIHAGIDEMDVFFNIDLNNFLDVSSYVFC